MSYFNNLQFVNPWWFLLIPIICAVFIWFYLQRSTYFPRLNMSTLQGVSGINTFRSRLGLLAPILRGLSLLALVFAMARPQSVLQEEEIKAEGIDIVLVMDLSSSMLAQDFRPDRLWVSKAVAGDFVRGRKYDRIGLAAFAGEAYTQAPLTTDHSVILDFLNPEAGLQCGRLQDGTAIGMGLTTAVNRLKDSEVKSKVVILLTDGVNNAGYVKPLTAAEIAQEFDVKVYTIGVGSTGDAYTPVTRNANGVYRFGLSRVEIDEALLKEIADMTGGRYFRATNEESLQRIYASIDQLEKTEIEVSILKRYQDKFYPFAFFGLLCLFVEMILKYTILRSIP